MGLPKFIPSPPPVREKPPTEQKPVIPEDRLTKIFEGDISARAAGLSLSKTELGETGDILLNRVDITLGHEHVRGLADLLKEGKTLITESLITVLNARGLVVLAQCLSHLLQNAGSNKIYFVKKHYDGDASDSRYQNSLYVGVGK